MTPTVMIGRANTIVRPPPMMMIFTATAIVVVLLLTIAPERVSGFVIVDGSRTTTSTTVPPKSNNAKKTFHVSSQHRRQRQHHRHYHSISPLVVRLYSSITNDNDNNDDDRLLLLKEQYDEFQKILPMVKQRASKELVEEYETKLQSDGQTWYDRPDLQEEFLSKVEYEQQQRMIKLEIIIKDTYPDIYQSYINQAKQEQTQHHKSLLTITPQSSSDDTSTSTISLAIERPDLMIRMEQEYEIWNVMEQEIKNLAPDLYSDVHDELVLEQQKRQQQEDNGDDRDEVPSLSSILMERKDLLKLVNTKINQLRQSVEDITEAVMKPKRKKNNSKQQKDAANKKKKGFG